MYTNKKTVLISREQSKQWIEVFEQLLPKHMTGTVYNRGAIVDIIAMAKSLLPASYVIDKPEADKIEIDAGIFGIKAECISNKVQRTIYYRLKDKKRKTGDYYWMKANRMHFDIRVFLCTILVKYLMETIMGKAIHAERQVVAAEELAKLNQRIDALQGTDTRAHQAAELLDRLQPTEESDDRLSQLEERINKLEKTVGQRLKVHYLRIKELEDTIQTQIQLAALRKEKPSKPHWWEVLASRWT